MFRQHPLFLTCFKVFYPCQARLNGVWATEADVFCESARLLDFLLYRSDISPCQVESLWDQLEIRVRNMKINATDFDKRIFTGVVFHIVRAVLAQHTECCYCEATCDKLICILEKKLNGIIDNDLETKIKEKLLEQSDILREWINSYSTDWLSDKIGEVLNKGKNSETDNFEPIGTTFSRTSLLPEYLIDIIGQRLSLAMKLNASPDDFRKLFSGVDQRFDIIWLGTQGELRDLFKMLTSKYIKPKSGYQLILKSHFTDNEGKRFNNLKGAKSIDKFKSVINDCEYLLQHLLENLSEIMKRIISENETALIEAGYFDQLQASKQAGMRIQNKRR